MAGMNAALTTGERGSELLLRHCESLTEVDRPQAYERLEDAVGEALARMLVAALRDRRERLAA